jgi:hypothetical protein
MAELEVFGLAKVRVRVRDRVRVVVPKQVEDFPRRMIANPNLLP